MRLLNTTTLVPEEFFNNAIPAYAILSHTWEKDEFLFKDLETGQGQSKAGFSKIKRSCALARDDGHGYIWIDTCCIDKSSSAELSEAINSMYHWYGRATICYAYLADVSEPDDAFVWSGSDIPPISNFANSRWFTRGWTLQELLAPSEVMFLSSTWTKIGMKNDLVEPISQITGIHSDILSGHEHMRSPSVATKMSWASQRTTTRVEDMAYSLMGIFDVNMPMLYGEGDKAFIRLQEEILKTSEDDSLFVWIDESAEPSHQQGLLAKTPAHFRHSGMILPYFEGDVHQSRSMTSRGLALSIWIQREFLALPAWLQRRGTKVFTATPRCFMPPRYNQCPTIYLLELSGALNQYARIMSNEPFTMVEWKPHENRLIYVRQEEAASLQRALYMENVLQISVRYDHVRFRDFRFVNFQTQRIHSTDEYVPQTLRIFIEAEEENHWRRRGQYDENMQAMYSEVLAIYYFQDINHGMLAVLLGIHSFSGPFFCVKYCDSMLDLDNPEPLTDCVEISKVFSDDRVRVRFVASSFSPDHKYMVQLRIGPPVRNNSDIIS